VTPASAARHYFTAQTFLTRLPAPAWVGYAPEWVPPSLAWFPVVGAVTAVLVTGALHEDALADTADGMGGGRDTAHTLEIMRDSRVGSYGVVALVLACLLRVALLVALSPATAFSALVLAHSLARASVLPLMTSLPYLRDSGAGAPFVGERPPGTTAVFVAVLVIIIAVFGGVLAAGAAAVISGLAYLYFSKRLGGITGDGFGAVIVVAECAVLLAMVVQA